MQTLRPFCGRLRLVLGQNGAVQCASVSNSAWFAKRRGSDTSGYAVYDGLQSHTCESENLKHRGVIPAFVACMSTVADAGAMPMPTVKSGTRKLDVTREELEKLIEARSVHLYDVREPDEVKETGTIPNAVNIPLSQLKASLSLDAEQFKVNFKCVKPAKDDQNIVFYGFCSIKSTTALEIAHKLGFKKARHYPGGWEEWSRLMEKP